LLARLRALARRGLAARPTTLSAGDLSLDPATRRVRRGAEAIELTRREFDVLETLLRADGAQVSKSELLDRVWGYDHEVDELAPVMNQMLDRLERASDRQQQFVADASHELRSPLSTIRTVAEVGGLDQSDTRITAMSDDIVAEADRMESMIADLLDLARLNGQQRTQPAATDLVELAQVVVAQVEYGDVTVEVSVEPTMAVVFPAQVERAIRNLLENACLHATRLAAGPRAVQVWGSRSIAERHGGTVMVVESSELGGARFELRMPDVVG